MSLPVYIYTEDEYFFLKIRVLCQRENITLLRIAKESEAYPVLLWDVDTEGEPLFPKRAHGRVLLVSREALAGTVRLPMANRALLAFLRGEGGGERLTLDESARVARIYGEEIRLTELEGALLSYLILRGGECATNEELCDHLWGGQASAGAVNVYIHYLREKLELRGEKIILVRRGRGYYIEPKFLEGDKLC